ncbi:pyrroline-5-carboxylate reductase [Pelagibacteraceae bacterium]|nr:pyrroline-5-carboxylate reductase [Pelagibacteraceae bacterium]
MKKILLIGCGHMGNALLTSWIKSNKYTVTVIDPKKNIYLKKKYNNKINIIKSILNLDKIIDYDFVVLAIRPFDLDTFLEQFSKIRFKKHTILISVIAGKKINNFRYKLKNINTFFRVMPNMPASIGESMNCIVSNKSASKLKTNEVIKLFSYSGISLLLENENQIDMATAVSGSGPGFVFNLIDAMEKAAIKIGFKKHIAKTLVSQTFRGSINLLLKNNNLSAKDLVNTVATKGGTTEAGLNIMKKNKMHKIFSDLTKASYKKAKEQGK